MYKQGEILSINYDVWISGKKLNQGKKSCITSIDIKETDEGADSCTIQISDPQFLFIEDDIFIEKNSVKVRLGWDNSTYKVEFKGYISLVDINFDSDGVPKLTINCMDRTHKMNRKKRNKTYKKTTTAKIVKKIAKQHGFAAKIEKGYKFAKQETITQSDKTDIEFLTDLAKSEVHPFSVRLVGNTIHYVKRGKLKSPKQTLTYRNYPHEIISFSPKINKEEKKDEIKKSSMSGKTKGISNHNLKTKDFKVGGSFDKELKFNYDNLENLPDLSNLDFDKFDKIKNWKFGEDGEWQNNSHYSQRWRKRGGGESHLSGGSSYGANWGGY